MGWRETTGNWTQKSIADENVGCIGIPFPLSEILSSVCRGGLSSLSSFHEFFMNSRGNVRVGGQSVTGASRRKYYCLQSSVLCPPMMQKSNTREKNLSRKTTFARGRSNIRTLLQGSGTKIPQKKV
jgi:hypothetical protein